MAVVPQLALYICFVAYTALGAKVITSYAVKYEYQSTSIFWLVYSYQM